MNTVPRYLHVSLFTGQQISARKVKHSAPQITDSKLPNIRYLVLHIWLVECELFPFFCQKASALGKAWTSPHFTWYLVLQNSAFVLFFFPFLAIAWISLETISDVILNLWNLKHAFKILWNKDVSYQTKNAVGIDKVTFL